MADTKRKISDYEELYAVRLGGGEVILAENPNADARYMVCDCSWDNPFGAEVYTNALGSEDYLEMMKEFTKRLAARVAVLETERETRGIPLQPLTAANCRLAGETDLNGRVVVIKLEKLAPEYRTIDYQWALCTGGFGASANSRGRTVYCKNLISGKTEGYTRSDIVGTISTNRLPTWARVNLDALQQSKAKDTTIVEEKPLDKEDFWGIIDAARESSGGWQGMFDLLVEALVQLEEQDIVQFKLIFNEYSDLAYKEKLWAAAAMMHNGCSDDGFIDFRAWLVAQGKEVYLNALADPDSLADVAAVRAIGNAVYESNHMTPMNGYFDAASFEEMSYAATDAYEKKLGSGADIYSVLEKMSLSDQEKADITSEITYAADIDEKWTGHDNEWTDTFAELKKRCPKLCKLFNDEDPSEVTAISLGKTTEKESVLAKIRQSNQQNVPQKPKNNKRDKGGPEL